MKAWARHLAVASLLIVLGMAIGTRVTTDHFRPLLDGAYAQVIGCVAARDNLAGLAQEQGKALGDLTLAAQARQARAEHALAEATASAQVDYASANRLQQERIGGNQCEASVLIIDKELDL